MGHILVVDDEPPILVAVSEALRDEGHTVLSAADGLVQDLTQAMDDVFLVAVPFMAVAFVIALTMRERPLQGREPAAPADPPEVSVVH